MPVETSIIIRTKNEAECLATTLKMIFSQTYKNYEVIIIDSGSTDETIKIAKQFPTRIFRIQPEKFSYPYALNYGIKKAKGNRFIVIIPGHSVPISDTWLQDGIDNFKKYKKIMGVFGFLKPLPNGSFWDRFFMNGLNFLGHLFTNKRRYIINEAGMGIMGFTNAIILKKLWDRRRFNEKYGLGGEDGEWANYWFKRGYRAIKDRKFTVYHSHKLGLLGWHKQWKYWKSLDRPHSFKRLHFRK